ncbi:cell division protein FtsQ [Pelagibacteraceae bacterium]|nr:cell division protein FtsQ [Pelagibacteraceae bacterium]
MHQYVGKKNKLILYIILLLILSTTSVKFTEKQKKYSLKINKIEVMGLSSLKNLEIKNELNNIFFQNIFILEKKEINKIIKKHNIIEEYHIKKIYPSTINVNIKPTKLVGRVADNNQLVVGANGKLILIDTFDKTLPFIFGEFDSKKFLKFQKNIELAKFNFNELKEIYFFPSNRWDILTINDVLIKLPQNDMLKSLKLAYKIINNSQFKDQRIIDLRVESHVVTQ